MSRLFGFMFVVGVLVACRPAPGDDPYGDMEVFPEPEEVATEFLLGPDPYVPGQERLSFGVYYEGDYSEAREVDEQTRWLYITISLATELAPPRTPKASASQNDAKASKPPSLRMAALLGGEAVSRGTMGVTCQRGRR